MSPAPVRFAGRRVSAAAAAVPRSPRRTNRPRPSADARSWSIGTELPDSSMHSACNSPISKQRRHPLHDNILKVVTIQIWIEGELRVVADQGG